MFRLDLTRKIALSYLKGYGKDELSDGANRFYREFLAERKVSEVWDILPRLSNIILVSGTIDVVAEVISREVGATAFLSSELYYEQNRCTGRLRNDLLRKKHIALKECGYLPPYETVITDNIADIRLLTDATEPIVVEYGNKVRWLCVSKKRGCPLRFLSQTKTYGR